MLFGPLTTAPAPNGGEAFDRVVFAVYDRSRDQENLRAFEAQFAAHRPPSG